jgi:hypothetical protein
VVHPSGKVVIFAGDRRAGKTTTALNLTRRYGWRLLTDELVFLVRRTPVIEPFPRSIGVAARIDQESGSMVEKVFVPVNTMISEVATEQALASHIVILEPGSSTGRPVLETVAPSAALTSLLPHHIDVGSSADESFVTLLQLTERCPAAVFRYQHPADLLALPRTLEESWGIAAIRNHDQPGDDTLFQIPEGTDHYG